ncbi:MAG: diaminopimelate decarboxylase [Candidatus Omnitrophica bacterium]|nr:diaminopimelate decarboxylase [Candidatus Omnitrophota bacterium]MCM8817542.1 diaminopimelate decarboxylase [Candidatus Omnitrophota bacterium]
MEKYLEMISDGLYTFHQGSLMVEKVFAKDICSRFGTPVYVYSATFIENQIRKLREAFKSVSPLICYSMKANNNMEVLKLIRKQGCGVDIVSGGELAKATKAGFKGDKIVFAGVGKTREEIIAALNKRIYLFTVESVEELKTINETAKSLKKIADVTLRINLDVEVDTHHYIKTAKKETKFGLPEKQVESIINSRNEFSNLNILGIQFHLGSNIKSSTPYIEALKRLKRFLKKANFKPSVIDIGGGFGIQYRDETIEQIMDFGNKICEFFVENFPGVSMVIEPGRFIVGNAGILLTQVVYNKKTPHKNFLIVDAGMNDLIRPSLYNSYHEILPVFFKKGKLIKYDVVGPICETGDFLGKERLLPDGLDSGDLIAVMGAGAYGFSMSSNYNGRPRVAEVMVRGGKMKCCRRREKFDDLWKHEI